MGIARHTLWDVVSKNTLLHPVHAARQPGCAMHKTQQRVALPRTPTRSTLQCQLATSTPLQDCDVGMAGVSLCNGRNLLAAT